MSDDIYTLRTPNNSPLDDGPATFVKVNGHEYAVVRVRKGDWWVYGYNPETRQSYLDATNLATREAALVWVGLDSARPRL